MIRRALLLLPLIAASIHAASRPHWVVSWTAAVQGPYPTGNASAQPNLSLAFPSPPSGASDQSFRMIVRPDIWESQLRIRLSNAFGTKPVTFDGVYVGVQMSGAALLPGTNRPVLFHRGSSIVVQPGGSTWSDPVPLPFVRAGQIAGRKLAVSFHIAGPSGPMTWHAKALTTSYLSAGPGSGAKGGEEGEAAFPCPTTSWYFVDAVDMMAPATTHAVVAFGDSITDGTASTLNGDDRWPDVLSLSFTCQIWRSVLRSKLRNRRQSDRWPANLLRNEAFRRRTFGARSDQSRHFDSFRRRRRHLA